MINSSMAELGWLLAPVAALAFGCLALVPLGRQVLARGVIFIDLAVAQVAACGALLAQLFSSPHKHGAHTSLHGHEHGHEHGEHEHEHGHSGHGHEHGHGHGHEQALPAAGRPAPATGHQDSHPNDPHSHLHPHHGDEYDQHAPLHAHAHSAGDSPGQLPEHPGPQAGTGPIDGAAPLCQPGTAMPCPSDESATTGLITLLNELLQAFPWLPALFASAGALTVWWLARRVPAQREALIGLVYVAAASAALLMASTDPHGRERLDSLLAADVLWAPWPPVILLGLAGLLVLLLSLVPRRSAAGLWHDALFYPVFALALSIAVPVLGLYLVFALLIGPALWQRHRPGLPRLYLLAGTACLAGLGLSWWQDWPSGTCVAICLSVTGLASTIGRPRTRPAA